eukprot:scaffold149855_cov17-Prasinocladus_malaysianus.AAC.1
MKRYCAMSLHLSLHMKGTSSVKSSVRDPFPRLLGSVRGVARRERAAPSWRHAPSHAHNRG